MAIGYIGCYLSPTKIPIGDLLANEKRLDHSTARAAILARSQMWEGLPASQLFGIESNAALLSRYQDTEKLEKDIRCNWNIDHARVERSLTTTAIFVSLLDRFFALDG